MNFIPSSHRNLQFHAMGGGRSAGVENLNVITRPWLLESRKYNGRAGDIVTG